MAKLEIAIPHNLPQEEAIKRIKQLLTETKKEHGNIIDNVKEKWTGNKSTFSFTAKGFDIAGTLAVHPRTVELESDLPFALSFFKGIITSVIQNKATELLK